MARPAPRKKRRQAPAEAPAEEKKAPAKKTATRRKQD
jgi:hypothetical protein